MLFIKCDKFIFIIFKHEVGEVAERVVCVSRLLFCKKGHE